jgi:hypothetical protein
MAVAPMKPSETVSSMARFIGSSGGSRWSLRD